MLLVQQTRELTALEMGDPSIHDTVLLDVTAFRMSVAEAPRLAQIVEDTINLFLSRDAVRVTPRVQILD